MSQFYLFRPDTINQARICLWLQKEGVTPEDLAKVQLYPSMVRITNPAGQYMDIYADQAGNVRILDITREREKELLWRMDNETNDPEAQEWRAELTADEAAMVEQLDKAYVSGLAQIAEKVLPPEQWRTASPGVARKIGRIDYLDTAGNVIERNEYDSEEKTDFQRDIRTAVYFGDPVAVAFYEHIKATEIPYDFLLEHDIPFTVEAAEPEPEAVSAEEDLGYDDDMYWG